MNLTEQQIAALEADRLKLIVVPLKVQPGPQYVDFGIEPNALACFSADEEDVDLIPLPHTIGQTIPTPHGNLIVTDVQVKRIREATEADVRKSCIRIGPDAWDRNPWCAFVSVRKEGE